MSEDHSGAHAGRPPGRRPRGLPVPVLVAGFVLLALLPMIAAVASGVAPAARASEIGSALGMLAGAVLLLQFVSSGRFEALSGRIGIDRTMGFHRIAAMLALAAALLHPLAYVAPTLLADPQAGLHRIGNMLASGRLRSGVLALALLAFVTMFALWRPRLPVRYEFWRVLHGPAAVATGALMLHHALGVGGYAEAPIVRMAWALLALIAVVSVVLVYLVRPMVMARGGWQVESVQRIAQDVIELTLRATGTSSLTFRGGQFVWLTIAPHRPPFHDHPFSIASSCAELPRLRFIVREAGDCTAALHLRVPGTKVALDGPHGSFVLPDDGAVIVMIAGGVGIAPILGMLEEAALNGDRRAFRLLYAVRSADGLAMRERIEDLSRVLNLTTAYHVDEDPGAGKPARRLTGAEIDTLVAGVEPRTVTAMVCGPASMMELATDRLIERGVPQRAIHYERFDYVAGQSRLDRERRRHVVSILMAIVAATFAFGFRW